MSALWALVATDGSYLLRWTGGEHPSECGHADECEGCTVLAIERLPDETVGENIDAETGAVVFDLDLVLPQLVAEIKAEAGRRIEAAVPLWKQINDLNSPPSAPGRIQRRQRVEDLRTWSDQLEELAAQAASVADVKAIRSELS